MPLLRPIPFFLPIYAPAEVELTSYMLLSMTERIRRLKGINLNDMDALSAQKDMSTMAQMAMWLVRQMNPRGAFSSTQVNNYRSCGSLKISVGFNTAF